MNADIRYVIERSGEVVIQRKTCGRFWSVMSALSIPFGGWLYIAHVFRWPHDWKLMDNELYGELHKQNKLARALKASITKEAAIRGKLKRVKEEISASGDKRKAHSYHEVMKLKFGELIFKQQPFKTAPKETWKQILLSDFDNVHSKAEGHMARARRDLGSKDTAKDRIGKTIAFTGENLEQFGLNLTENGIDEFEHIDMKKQNGKKEGSKKNRRRGETDESYAKRMAAL